MVFSSDTEKMKWKAIFAYYVPDLTEMKNLKRDLVRERVNLFNYHLGILCYTYSPQNTTQMK